MTRIRTMVIDGKKTELKVSEYDSLALQFSRYIKSAKNQDNIDIPYTKDERGYLTFDGTVIGGKLVTFEYSYDYKTEAEWEKLF